MTYRYKVTLSGIKGFFRIYLINGDNTLYAFHKQMRADMAFAPDQLILFKALDAYGGVVARYGLFDLGAGAVDEIRISDTVKNGVESFVYFYDVENRKSVIVTLEGEDGSNVLHPVLVESKGPDPVEFENGYVAFEDLPDSKRHLPGEEDRKSGSLAGLLGIDPDDLDEDDDDEDDDNDEDGGDNGDKEEEDLVYDESEGVI